MPVEVEKCQDKVECFNADLKADWERWQSNKRQDFKQLLTGMADKNINYYEKVHWLPKAPLLLHCRSMDFKYHVFTDQIYTQEFLRNVDIDTTKTRFCSMYLYLVNMGLEPVTLKLYIWPLNISGNN